MTDADALRAVCEEQPLDDTPRLILADWYDNHDQPDDALAQRLDVALRKVLADPESDAPRLEYAKICRGYGRVDRAEFIECQVELAVLASKEWPPPCSGSKERKSWRCGCRVCVLRRRAGELLEAGGHDWIGKEWAEVINRSPTLVTTDGWRNNGWTFVRGFVEAVAMSWEAFAAAGDQLVAMTPVREVTLTTVPSVDSQHGQQRLRLIGENAWHELADLPAIRRGDIHSVIGRDRIRRDILSRRWPQIRTWHLPPEPTPQYAPGRLVVEQPQDGSRILTVGWEVEPVYGDIHLKSDYSRINPERMLREYRLHLEADSREVGRPTLGMRFGPVTGTLRDSGGRVRVESAVLVDIEPRHNSVILRAAPLAVPTYEPAAWHADPATATPIADLRRFREMPNRMRSHDPTEDSPLQREVEWIGQMVASNRITAEEGIAALRRLLELPEPAGEPAQL